MRGCGALMVLACAAVCVSGLAAPDLSDGVQVLAMLADPYGANTYLLKDQFELMGWEVTLMGIDRSVSACSRLCSTLFTDASVDEIESASAYDVLVVMPTPGTFQRKPNPVGDLRDSERAVGLVQEAYDAGLTLYTGCSGILLFGDAGLLEGMNVIAHPNRAANCRAFGANCTIGSQTVPPMIDGQLVTATNQRVWPLEIAAAIARSLDAHSSFSPSLDLITAVDVEPVMEAIESDEDDIEAWALGEGLGEVGRDVCSVDGGAILVGMRYSSERREDVLVVKRDAHGSIEWAKAIGGPGRDVGEAVCVSEDGTIFIAGYTTSAGRGAEDVLVIKLSPAGDLAWASTFGGSDYDAAFDLCPTTGGGVAVCGLTYSFGAGISDLYVVKVSREGEAAWTKTYGGERIDRGSSIRRLSDGGYIIGGGTSSFGAGNVDMYVVRLSSAGEEVWANAYGRNVYDIAGGVIPVRGGGFLVTGHGDLEGSELMALTVMRIDDAGEEIWTTRLGARTDYDYGLGAVELESGDFLIAGVTNHPDQGMNDIWLHVIDENGNSTIDYRFGGRAAEWPGGVCLTEDGTVLVAGCTASFGQGGFDALLLKLAVE
jgi:putative intracellular protease/amidase